MNKYFRSFLLLLLTPLIIISTLLYPFSFSGVTKTYASEYTNSKESNARNENDILLDNSFANVVSLSTMSIQNNIKLDSIDKLPSMFFTPSESLSMETFSKKTPLYNIRICYPITTNTNVNEAIASEINMLSEQFQQKKSSGEIDIRFTYYESVQNVLSFIIESTEITPDSDAKTTLYAYTFDILNGIRLKINDIFDPSTDYEKVIRDQLTVTFNMYFSSKDSFDYSFLLNTQNFISAEKYGEHQFFAIDKTNLYFIIDGKIKTAIPLNLFTVKINIKVIELLENTVLVNTENSKKPDKNKSYVALTFDDGPASFTSKLLDTLTELDVKATFFVQGKSAKSNPATIKKMYENGHEIANHSFSHRDLAKISSSDASLQITQTNDIIENLTGQKPVLFRPPYGSRNSNLDNLVKSQGMSSILWSVDPQDWKVKNSQKVAEHVISKSKTGDIILLHDIHETTVNAIPDIIKGLKAKGYEFITVSELIALKSERVDGQVYKNVKYKN